MFRKLAESVSGTDTRFLVHAIRYTQKIRIQPPPPFFSGRIRIFWVYLMAWTRNLVSVPLTDSASFLNMNEILLLLYAQEVLAHFEK